MSNVSRPLSESDDGTIEERDVPTSPEELDAWLTSTEQRVSSLVAGFLTDHLISAWRRFHRSAVSLTAAGDMAVWDEFPEAWRQFVALRMAGPISGIYIDGALSAWITAPPPPASFAPAWSAIVNDAALTYQQSATNRLVAVGDDIWREVRTLSVDAIREGATNEVLKQGIEDLTGFSEFRADTIGRTETVAAYNGGDMDGAKALGEFGPAEKLWLAALDARTRETHAEANDQVVPFDGKFMVGGVAMDRPHDPGAPPEEVVNCRCVVLFLYPGDLRPDGSIVPGESEISP